MYADLTRDTFDANKRFSRVIIQQGRVPLDADLNEQASILLHAERRLAADLIGPHGGPAQAAGFKITEDAAKLVIGKGRYYVDGILVECDGPTEYFEQPNLPLNAQADRLPNVPYVLALHVWERHKSAAEDESILEPALGGPDTASRAEIVWQVRAYPAAAIDDDPNAITGDAVVEFLRGDPAKVGMMTARIPETEVDDSPCVLSPGARFRGLANQLYRVEIHAGGAIDADGDPVGQPIPTFKWSRENGSVVLPVRSLRGGRAQVDTVGRDDRLGVHEGDRVEILSDDVILRADAPLALARVQRVDRDAGAIELESETALPTYETNERHPFLRRWDQQEPARAATDDQPAADEEIDLVNGAVPVTTRWVELEDGIQVRFAAGEYRAGDYWLIPARTATGDIQWPTTRDANGDVVPAAQSPRGLERHYAPLAIVRQNGITDFRRCFEPLAKPCV